MGVDTSSVIGYGLAVDITQENTEKVAQWVNHILGTEFGFVSKDDELDLGLIDLGEMHDLIYEMSENEKVISELSLSIGVFDPESSSPKLMVHASIIYAGQRDAVPFTLLPTSIDLEIEERLNSLSKSLNDEPYGLFFGQYFW